MVLTRERSARLRLKRFHRRSTAPYQTYHTFEEDLIWRSQIGKVGVAVVANVIYSFGLIASIWNERAKFVSRRPARRICPICPPVPAGKASPAMRLPGFEWFKPATSSRPMRYHSMPTYPFGFTLMGGNFLSLQQQMLPGAPKE